MSDVEVGAVTDTTLVASPRRYLVFAIVSVGLFLVAVDQTIVATALDAIGMDLHARVNWSSWTITVYSLGQVITMPIAGKISDQLGRRQVFLTAAAIFTIASMFCGLAGNVYELVILRALQAAGGGALIPAATGIVSDEFGPSRDRAVGFFTSIFPIGGVAGPVLGGIFVTYWSWRGVFLVNVPLGIVLIALGVVFISDNRHVSRGPLDIPGIALLSVSLLLVMTSIAYLGGPGATLVSPLFLVPVALAVAGIAAFIRHMKRSPTPFVPVRLLYGRGFGAMNLINFLYGIAALGVGAIVPLYAQDRYHIPALQAGTLLTARAVGMVAFASLATWSLRRTGVRLPQITGFLLIAVGAFLMWMRPIGLSPYAWLAVAAGIAGVGMGISVPATNNATLSVAPDQAAGIAGLRGMFRQSGAITGVSVATAVMASSSSAGAAQGIVFAGFAVVLVLATPVVLLVPEHRGPW